jgi:hypothetical protein
MQQNTEQPERAAEQRSTAVENAVGCHRRGQLLLLLIAAAFCRERATTSELYASAHNTLYHMGTATVGYITQ